MSDIFVFQTKFIDLMVLAIAIESITLNLGYEAWLISAIWNELTDIKMRHTLSKAMTPESFLPFRNSHTTEALYTILETEKELDSLISASHAIFPTTVTSQSLWESWLRIWASLDAPLVQLLLWIFTGPIHKIFWNTSRQKKSGIVTTAKAVITKST